MATKRVQLRKRTLIALLVGMMALGAVVGGGFLMTITGFGQRAHGGVVYAPPAAIDNTGATDVTDALNTWIAQDTSDGTSGDPSAITLTGTYRVEYGLTVGNVAHTVAQPGLPAYTRNHVILDLSNATLLQTDATPWKVNGVVVQPRKRWGVPLLKFVGDTDVRVLGGHLTSTNTLGTYSSPREPWAGVTIASGVQGLDLVGLDIEHVWGDFVDISGQPWPKDILVDGGHFERNGRQGVTFNNVDNLEIRHVDFINVERMLFDHEPTATGGATNVYIHDNTGDTGGMGYMNLSPGNTPLSAIRVENNHLFSGHMRVLASAGPSTVARVGFTFSGNTTATTSQYSGGYLARTPLIWVPGNWDNVTITNNHDVGTVNATAVMVNAASTNVTTTPNDFVGFKPAG